MGTLYADPGTPVPVCRAQSGRGLAGRPRPSCGASTLYSPNIVEGVFSEVRIHGVLRSSAHSWCSDVFCAMAHIHLP